jgi:hypothetical protein
MLCNNALITTIAVKNPGDDGSLETVEEMKNWQKQAFGAEIIRVLKRASY